MDDADLWECFSLLARDMSDSVDVSGTLQVAVDGAVELVDHATSAGISMVHHHRSIDTPAATDAVARRGDELQYELDEGPCLQSIYQQETVLVRDLLTEQRWPRWSSRITEETGMRSMLCLQLFVTENTLGALNLYSTTPDAFDADDRATALALAAHVAVALTAAQEFESLESTITSRTVIAQAEGMLMQRYGLTAQKAFAVLARESQVSHRRLRDIAQELVSNGVVKEFPLT